MNNLIDEIEALEATWLDKTIEFKPEYFNYRIDVGGERWYCRVHKDGRVLSAPSFSRVQNYCAPASHFLTEWKIEKGKELSKWISVNSAHYGTFFHILCGQYLKGQSLKLDRAWLTMLLQEFCTNKDINFRDLSEWIDSEKRDLRKDLYGFAVWCRDYKVKPLAIEYPLMQAEGLCAGTADLICRLTIDEIEFVALVDIKSGQSGFYEDNEIQLRAYKDLWDEEYPAMKITRCYNYGCHNYRIPLSARVTPYKFKDQTDSPVAYKWPLWLKEFHGDIRNKVNFFKYDFKPDAVININIVEEQSLFEEYDLIGRAKETAETLF